MVFLKQLSWIIKLKHTSGSQHIKFNKNFLFSLFTKFYSIIRFTLKPNKTPHIKECVWDVNNFNDGITRDYGWESLKYFADRSHQTSIHAWHVFSSFFLRKTCFINFLRSRKFPACLEFYWNKKVSQIGLGVNVA